MNAASNIDDGKDARRGGGLKTYEGNAYNAYRSAMLTAFVHTIS